MERATRRDPLRRRFARPRPSGEVVCYWDYGDFLDADAVTYRAFAYLAEFEERLEAGGFRNGVRDAAGEGADWTSRDGKPCGYEGCLADSFRFLQAVVLREPALRARHYRPIRRAETAVPELVTSGAGR